MNISALGKPLLLLISLACVGMLAVGLYLQLQLEMLPCPLCILQRYAFVLVALCALLGVSCRHDCYGLVRHSLAWRR